MLRISSIALAVACACMGAGQCKPEGIDDRRVSVNAVDQSLSDVLADLSRQTGAGVVLRGTEIPRVTLSLRNVALSDALNALADALDLLAYWDKETLTAWVSEEALAQVARDLSAGRADTARALSAVAAGPTYGSRQQGAKLAAALTELIRQQTRAVLSGQSTEAELARALSGAPALDKQTRISLAAAAVRLFLRDGDRDAALETWEQTLPGEGAWPGVVAGAELLLHLHYTGDSRAGRFFSDSFNLDHALALLAEGWRLKTYKEALHLARLQASYAREANRDRDARALEIGIQTRLDAPRLVEVTCVVDREATGDPEWQPRVRARVARVSEVFNKHFGIQFGVTEMATWDPEADGDFQNKYDSLKEALGGRRPELTIGFILEVFHMHPSEFNPAHKHFWLGFGCPHNGAYLLARDFSLEFEANDAVSQWALSPEAVSQTLTHEMGHMFGALHTEDPGSVMHPVSQTPPVFAFDDLNRRIVLRRKWQDLSCGMASLDEPELVGLIQDYRELARVTTIENGARQEEARAHLALAKLYTQRRAPDRAADELAQVLAIGEPVDVAAEAQMMLQTR